MATGAFPLGFDPADLRAAEALGQVRVAEARLLRPDEIVPQFEINSAVLEPVRPKFEPAEV